MAKPKLDKFNSTWLESNLDNFKVTMEDGHVEYVKSKTEFLAKMQCAHFKLTEHGRPIKAEPVDPEEVPKKDKPMKDKEEEVITVTGHDIVRAVVESSKEESEKLEKEIKKQAELLIEAHGIRIARIVCVEMQVEYATYPDEQRLDFWRAVTKELEKVK